ncbi:MAG: type II toxin-antitoxin system RelE/ParE family toxin [Proteobacteria bacterium]|nr:type II toxin-antitoxin system RelE/ParE family toxin [Pseudomonadota bacterium]
MKRKYKVKWALPANLDLVEIAEFAMQDSPQAARKIVKKIRERISNLKHVPERGRVVPELAKHGITQYREMIISPWRILYQIDEKIVLIVLVVDGRRNLEDVLFKRIMR